MLCVKKYLLDINKYIHPFNQHEMDLKGLPCQRHN